MATQVKKVKKFFGGLGPGLVAGASDNDPTSVATLSVIGSITVYGLLRLVLLILPMLLTIQVISSRVGAVTGPEPPGSHLEQLRACLVHHQPVVRSRGRCRHHRGGPRGGAGRPSRYYSRTAGTSTFLCWPPSRPSSCW